MSTVRWVTFLLCMECVIVLAVIPRSVLSALIAAFVAVLFTLFCWSLGAFTRDPSPERLTDE